MKRGQTRNKRQKTNGKVRESKAGTEWKGTEDPDRVTPS